MRSSAVLLIPLTLCCLAYSQTSNSIHRLDGSKICAADADAFARQTLAAANVTGAQLALLNNGHLVWSAAYGHHRAAAQLLSLAPSLAMTPDTTTWAASITKSVFSAYVMQLVARGEICLDKPLASQLKKAAQ